MGELMEPGQAGFEGEAAPRVHHGVAEARRGHRQGHSPYEIGRILRDRPLGQPQIARTKGEELAIEPRLVGDPRQRGLAVGRLVAHGIPLPTRTERPAATLNDGLVAALGEKTSRDAELATPIGRSQQHRRGPSDSHCVRVPMIRQQHRPVGHRGGAVTIDADHGGVGGGKLGQLRDQAARQCHVQLPCSSPMTTES